MEPIYAVLIITNVIACFFVHWEVNHMHKKLDDFIESFDTPYQEGEEEDSNFPPLPKV